MGLITRFYGPNSKGSKLTIKEMDDNLYYLQSFGVSGVTYQNNVLTLINPTGGTNTVIINDFYTTGATYNNGIIYFDRNDQLSAYTVNISSLTGDSNTFVTGFTYDNTSNKLTISNNNNTSFDSYIDSFSGLTINGNLSVNTISATTYQNLPLDVFVTGGTFSNGTLTFENNTGGTFNITGLTKSLNNEWLIASGDTVTIEPFTQKFIYGDLYILGNLILNENSQLVVLNGNIISSGGTISGLGTIYSITLPEYNTFVTSGSFNPTNKEITFNGNFGFNPFSVNLSGLSTDNFYTTGATLNGSIIEFSRNDTVNAYSVDLNSLKFTGNTSGNCITDLYVTNVYGCSPVNIQTDLNVNGSVSATTYYGDGSNLSGISTQDIYVTGGTFSNGTASFTNNVGGTFNVTGFTSNSRTFNDTNVSNTFNGDILKVGSGNTTSGYVYYLENTNIWTPTNASSVSTSNGLLGIAIGTDPSIDGMLIYGYGNSSVFSGNTGSPLYLTTNNGLISENPPSGVGYVIRIVGYKLGNTNSMIFKPDPTWIELT